MRKLFIAFILTISTLQAQQPVHCAWYDTKFSLDEWNTIRAHPTVAIAAIQNSFEDCPAAQDMGMQWIDNLRVTMGAHGDSCLRRTIAMPRLKSVLGCKPQFGWEGDPWVVIDHHGRYGLLDALEDLPTQSDFEWAEDFGYGLALVMDQGKHAFMDHAGHRYAAAFSVEAIGAETEAVYLSARMPIAHSAITTVAPSVKLLCLDAEWLPTLKLAPETFPNLETLVIQGMKTRDRGDEHPLSVTVPIFPGLRRLVLACVKPLNLDKALSGMRNLRSLALIRTQLPSLPSNIGGLKDLEELCVENEGLARLPDGFGDLQKLRRLSLAGCGMKVFPEAILRLDSLRALDLSDNGFGIIPDGISRLKSLRSLQCRLCHLEQVPVTLFSLPALETLDLSENVLHGLPKGISPMPSLKMLDIHYGFNFRFDGSAKLFPTLCWLNIASSYDGVSPESIAEWRQIQILDLSDLDLEALPSELRQLQGLNVVILKENPCSDTAEKQAAIRKQMAEWLPNCKVYFD